MQARDSLNALYYYMSINDLRLAHAEADSDDLSYNSVMYLNLISLVEDCTVSTLAELLSISKSAVTMKVNDLTRQGLVVKEQSQRDRRVFFLRLSPSYAASQQLYDRPFDRALRKVQEDCTPEQLESFIQVLQCFNSELRQAVLS